MKKILSLAIVLTLILFSNSCFAVEEFQAFSAFDCDTNTYGTQANRLAVSTFQDLGYTNSLGTGQYLTTAYKSPVLSYIQTLSNNFAFYVLAHGNTALFTMEQNNFSQYIYPEDIEGYWYLIFINSCSTFSNDEMARAFKTVGYDQRAAMGWYDTVTFTGSYEWWSHFHNVAGLTNLRSACLAAADQCDNYTPIRLFGDKTWSGLS